MTMDRIEDLARRVLAGQPLGRAEALELAHLPSDRRGDLFTWAGRVRQARFGDQVKFCAIGAGRIGACSEDCRWCAQSARHGTAIQPGRSSPAELAEAARQAGREGASCFGIVNSGRHVRGQDIDDVAATVEALTDQPDLGVCASLGELDEADARRLARAGVTRYHHNLETSRRFYPSMVTTHAYDDRLATLRVAAGAGMRICCGGLLGLGETWEDRVDLAMTIRDETAADVVPLNFLSPIPGTPLEHQPPLEPMECLHIIALFRLVLPDADIKVAGGRANLRDLQSWVFAAGATSCMVGHYLTTKGRQTRDDVQMVRDLGLTLVRQFTPPAQRAR